MSMPRVMVIVNGSGVLSKGPACLEVLAVIDDLSNLTLVEDEHKLSIASESFVVDLDLDLKGMVI